MVSFLCGLVPSLEIVPDVRSFCKILIRRKSNPYASGLESGSLLLSLARYASAAANFNVLLQARPCVIAPFVRVGTSEHKSATLSG